MVAKTYNLDFEPEALRETVAQMLVNKSTPVSPVSQVAAAAGEPAAVPAKPAQLTTEPGRQPRDAQKAHTPKEPGSGGSAEDPEVKGFMTLNEIALKTGVPKDSILRKLELPQDIDGCTPVREWMHDRSKSIQDLRDAVEQYRKEKR
jgi:hypothetical protein